MARITKSDTAPSEAKHFSLAQAEFDLASASSTYETNDRNIIAAADAHPWLDVETDPAPADAAAEPDPLDPHDNPAADHLSISASESAIEAARANNEAIRSVAQGDIAAPTDQPTVEDAVRETLAVAAPDAEPQFADDAQDTVATPAAAAAPTSAPTPPAGSDDTSTSDDGSDD